MPKKTTVPRAGILKPRGAKKCVLPEEFQPGEILCDVAKKQWKLGPVVGKGGFGLIYLASDDLTAPVDTHASYVVKIEPHDNGPLFCELHFYQRAAKIESIDSWMQERKLKYLGVPKYISTGKHIKHGKSYRFMVMQRLSTDLQKVFSRSQTFLSETVLTLGLRMIDALEYLHENEYVHADIKAANMLLGYRCARIVQDEIYLVDYGLAFRYMVNGIHKGYKEDPRKVHDGTIEFTSRDAHSGACPSRRGDLEILGYCMLQWLCGQLPWEDNLTNPDYVRDSKIKYMRNIPSLLKDCFRGRDYPEAISKYLNVIVKLDYDEKPNYRLLRKILLDGLHKLGYRDEWKLYLPPVGDISATPLKKRVAQVQRKRKSSVSQESPQEYLSSKQLRITPKPPSRNLFTAEDESAVHVRQRRVALPGKTKPSKTVTKGQTDLSSASWELPTPSKPIRKTRSATGPKKTPPRRMKRSRKPRTDAAIQTTPGLKHN